MQKKWDEAYGRPDKQPGEACRVLLGNRHLLPASGTSLDLACGLGGNALLLARHGLASHGWDISPVALNKLVQAGAQQGLTIHTEQRDVENSPPPAHSFDVIVVSHFLHRPSSPAIAAALRPGGLLFYQTYHQQKVSDTGPSSAKFLLEPQELLKLFAELDVLYYREDGRSGDLSQGLRDIAYFVGRKPKA